VHTIATTDLLNNLPTMKLFVSFSYGAGLNVWLYVSCRSGLSVWLLF